tara:strand:+ start:946 stop:1569 length:624 start_codon:yes stop_codon:yes gene_type:complete
MKQLNPTITPRYYPSVPVTRSGGNFGKFMRLFTAERKEVLELLSGQLVKFDYQLSLTFKAETATHVLDTSTITKSCLTDRSIKSHSRASANFLYNFFAHGVMNEQWFELAEAIAKGYSLVELWVDATPMTCEHGCEPTELQASYRVSAPVAELKFDPDFLIWLADRVLSFYSHESKTDMNIRWQETVWWTEYKEGIERVKSYREQIA